MSGAYFVMNYHRPISPSTTMDMVHGELKKSLDYGDEMLHETSLGKLGKMELISATVCINDAAAIPCVDLAVAYRPHDKLSLNKIKLLYPSKDKLKSDLNELFILQRIIMGNGGLGQIMKNVSSVLVKNGTDKKYMYYHTEKDVLGDNIINVGALSV